MTRRARLIRDVALAAAFVLLVSAFDASGARASNGLNCQNPDYYPGRNALFGTCRVRLIAIDTLVGYYNANSTDPGPRA